MTGQGYVNIIDLATSRQAVVLRTKTCRKCGCSFVKAKEVVSKRSNTKRKHYCRPCAELLHII